MPGSGCNRSCVTTCNLTPSGARYASHELNFSSSASLFPLIFHLHLSGAGSRMNICPRSERVVALLHDSELDSPLRREVASHVAGCVVCTRTLAAFERVQELVVQAVSEQLEESDF